MKTICFSLLLTACALPVFSAGLAKSQDGPSVMSASPDDLFAMNNLLAWCIVPYDSVKRGPIERVQMLKRLGFTQYAWDWRQHHLEDFREEIAASRKHGVRIRAVWLWIDGKTDKMGQLGDANRLVIDAVEQAKLPVEFWVGVHPNVFEELDEKARIQKGATLLTYLRDEAAKSNSTIALYNHGDWFGEPENQVKLIEAVGDPSIGIVYNFHHGHPHIPKFATMLTKMLPYLRAVNVNGMIPEGPKILTIGEGTHEREMLRVLKDAGYKGPLGILCHIEDEDAEVVLRRNLAGLQKISGEFGKSALIE
jgi:sugar phosphate isomerase/epimerase